jgi:hypothetical protein
MYVWPVYHEGRVTPVKPVEARSHDIAATPSFSAYDAARENTPALSVEMSYNAAGHGLSRVAGAETGRYLDFFA